MILLVTTSSRARECAAALEQGTGHKTHVANSVPQAVTKMQAAEYDGLAIDQSLLESDFRALDTLLNRCGIAIPLYVNLALHSTERVVREAQVALRRADKEKLMATRTAEQVLRNQLRSQVTGILLNSELALRQKSISADVAEKLQLGARISGKDALPTANCLTWRGRPQTIVSGKRKIPLHLREGAQNPIFGY
jgi:CheY-like chemotaxis protein